MVLRQYPQVPPSAMIEFGGYLMVKPIEWEDFLDGLIQNEYPAYYRDQFGKQPSSLWKSNACILESLEKYLFYQYGVSIPKDNLFKVYNQSGDGVPPELLLEAIAAVIEPLGFEVEWVIVPDPELRAALGDAPRTVGIEQAAMFEGQPGVCMINIKPGESHAFYWEIMNTSRFHKEQFRMALTIKPAGQLSTKALSAEQSVAGFCKLLYEYLVEKDDSGQAKMEPLVKQIEALDECVHSQECMELKNFRQKVFQIVSSMLDLFREVGRTEPETDNDKATLIEAGELIRRIYSEAPALGIG
jgi:hypothetical protein